MAAEVRITTDENDRGEPFYVDPSVSVLPANWTGTRSAVTSPGGEHTVVPVSVSGQGQGQGQGQGPDTPILLYFESGEYITECQASPVAADSAVAVTDTGDVALLAAPDAEDGQDWRWHESDAGDSNPYGILLQWTPREDRIERLDTFANDCWGVYCVPDGSAITVLTRGPDHAIHLYDSTGSYLGRENVGRTASTCSFERQSSEWYVVAGDQTTDGDLIETDRYPVETDATRRLVSHVAVPAVQPEISSQNQPQAKAQLQSRSQTHIVDAESLPAEYEQFRGIDKAVHTYCGQQVTPATADRTHPTPTDALDAGVEICQACVENLPEPSNVECGDRQR